MKLYDNNSNLPLQSQPVPTRFYTLMVTLVILGSCFLAYQGCITVYEIYRKVLPDVALLKTQYPIAVKKEGKQIVFKFQKNRPANWIGLKQVSRKAVAAILMAEDAGFFQHAGYDPDAIKAAWEHNSRPGVKIKRGGSTITQQVAKNLFLTPEKTIVRKVRELLIAIQLEKQFSKGKILELYLNIAEWGPGTYGIEQASQRYFYKSAAYLTAREGAILAFMLPNPLKYQNSYRGGELSQFGANRVERILERMWRTGYLSDDEYASSGTSEPVPSSL